MTAGKAPEAPTSLPKLLGIAELAELFRVDPRTVRNWAHLGRLPRPLRVGGRGHLRWRSDQIRAFIEGLTHEQP